MSIDRISNVKTGYESSTSKVSEGQQRTQETIDKNSDTVDTAAVYNKDAGTSDSSKVYKRDTATINRLLEEAQQRQQTLRDLVEKMLLKQGQTLEASEDIYSLLREGKVEVDSETRLQAQRDIAEDGYWGVEQTALRLVSFAKALTGGDSSKAEEMISAVKKGFDQATKAWGGDLPSISKDTIDRAIKELEDWRDGKEE